MKQEHLNEIQGIVILAAGLIVLASLGSFVPEDLFWYTSHPNSPVHNLIRVVGAYLSGVLFFIFGYSAYLLVGFLFFWSWCKFSSRDLEFTPSKFISALVLLCVVSGVLSMTGSELSTLRFQRSGIVGYMCADFLTHYFGSAGAYIVFFSLGMLTLVLIGEFLISPFLFQFAGIFHEAMVKLRGVFSRSKTGEARPAAKASLARLRPNPAIPAKPLVPRVKVPELDDQESSVEEDSSSVKPSPVPQKPNIRITPAKNSTDSASATTDKPKMVGEYRLPPLDLLNTPPQVPATRMQSDLEQGARILESTLADFGVTVRVVDIERGPVITRYELEPAPGVKVGSITTLSDDIALVMKASAVRIVAPIPGKNRVGIEVPNGLIAAVYLKDVMGDSKFQNPTSKLMLGIGKDITGKPLIADLTEMPHLLIAGTTGSGKTVCVNSIIMSLLFNSSPEDVKFLMVDPKMVELTQYNDIPHMLCPTVTDPKKVSAALNWVVGEMESRYSMLSKAGARNIKGFNAKGNKLPYIVIVIDELADLMQVSAKTIESAITRLAQLSRAVGIHLILATQRPSVDVITGVIKANFPARISFKVASKVDSRTVLDLNGAESLLGKGDLLFIKPGDAKPTRGQCSYVTDEEVSRVIDFIKNQQQPEYNDQILQNQKSGGVGGSEQKDELYDDAVRVVIETNQASVSILQRRMRLGYTRAARLIDMMEQDGIVGPYCGSKPRDILVDREEWMMRNMGQGQEEKTG